MKILQEGVCLKMHNTVKEHYVPQFYLKNFKDDKGLLHIYDFKQKKIFTQSPKNICYENNLYETKWENAHPNLKEFVLQNSIENIFCKYEGEFSKVLTTILRVCIPSQNPNALILLENERNIFLRFIVNMVVRNPENMEVLALNKLELDDINNEDISQICNLLDDIGLGGGNSLCLAAKKKAMLTDEFENNFTQACFGALKKLNYTFFYSRTNSFITSNIPVCVGDDPIIIEDDKTCVYLALSPKVAVLFGNYKSSRNFKNRMICIEEKQVENFNRILIKHSDNKRILIANSDAIIRKYVEVVRSEYNSKL